MIWFFFLICQFCFLSSSKSLPRILTYFQVVEKSPDTSRCLGECSCKCCSSQSPAYLPTYRVDHLGCRSCVARVSSEIKTADVHCWVYSWKWCLWISIEMMLDAQNCFYKFLLEVPGSLLFQVFGFLFFFL